MDANPDNHKCLGCMQTARWWHVKYVHWLGTG